MIYMIYIYIHTGAAPPPSNRSLLLGGVHTQQCIICIYICTYKTVLFSICLTFVVLIIYSVPQMLFGGVSSYCIGIAANMSMLIMVLICHNIFHILLTTV